MPETWTISTRSAFLHELSAFEAKEVAQILKKVNLLTDDPTPDAQTKKQLKHLDGKLHRLRSGNFRVFYTFRDGVVSLLAVRRRNEGTYETDIDPEFLQGGEGSSVGESSERAETVGSWLAAPAPPSAQLPRAIDQALLDALHVPLPFHAALLCVATEDELLEAKVPQDVLSRVIDAVLSRPIDLVAAQPELVVNDGDDLLRYREGELIGFLLRLSPEQQRLVTWAVTSKGPTLLKGGPGTGKSTVALYRVQSILAALRKAKVEQPRVLFTTYTRALTRVSEQLLTQLLAPEDRACVEVKTADAILRPLAILAGESSSLVSSEAMREHITFAVAHATFEGNALKVASQRAAVTKLSQEFLVEEINGVIEGRGLETLDAYLEARRPGRKVALTKLQREAVWRVRDALVGQLRKKGVTTVEGWRKAARARIRDAGDVAQIYDAVLVDEAQDLSPTTIAALVGLCKRPGGVFFTADANQSIYGGSFRWSDAHEALRFQGRTAVLKANHRSTREIGEAAEAYLRVGTDAEVDEERVDAEYVHAGPLPAVRRVAMEGDEVQLLARFFRQATRSLRLGLGACAVLVPFKKTGTRIAELLVMAGIPARVVDVDELDLKDPGVKILTLKSAKGLEFPIVAVGGFGEQPFPFVPAQASDDERAEIEARERRTLFVAMTRAMRALLVIAPESDTSALLTGLMAPAWNDGRETA